MSQTSAPGNTQTVKRPRESRAGRLLYGRSLWFKIALVAVILLAGPIATPGVRTILLVTLVYGLYAMAYDVLLGYSDQPSLGQGLFFGLGTYGVALPIIDHGSGVGVALLITAVVGGLVAGLIGLVAVRLSDVFHVIFTALFASVAYMIANTLTPVTGGSGGKTITLPALQLGPWEVSLYGPYATYLLVAVVVAASYLVLDRLVHSPVGQMWTAIRENPQRAASVGINVYRYRLAAFALSGLLTAVAGGLYAITLRFASSEFFGFTWSVLPFVWVLIGGIGTLVGGLVGAVVFAVFQFYVAQLWTHYLLILGVALLVLLRLSPKGIVGSWRSYSSGRRLRHAGKKADGDNSSLEGDAR
jgi:branched-chain amino acid transport system permease protein